MNYLFYDYETSGLCEKFDQVFQFAAIKTDENLNHIGEPVEYFCKLRADVLPSPHAVKTNQIEIDELNSKGYCEFEFAKKVCEVLIGSGNQCIVGYNSKEFDNEFTRFLFYRNLLDPYAWSWSNGNSCLDLMDVLRLGYSFDRLNGICIEDDGEISFKLERLAKWNRLTHNEAHNAISDVEATIQLARLIREQCPKLFEYAVALRTYDGVSKIFADGGMFFHSSGFNGLEKKYLSLHYPICRHPRLWKSVIGWDLHHDPAQILNLDPRKILEQMYAKKEKREFYVGFGEFKLNKSPMVTRFSEREKGQISSPEVWQENLAKVQGTLDELTELARQVFNSSVPEIELDADLYAGDFLDEIKRERETFNCVSADPFCVMDSSFKSIRLRRLWRRLMARNYFDLICEDHQHKFKQFCFEKFASTDENKWRTRIIFNREYEKAVSDPTLSEKQRHCLISLRNYVEKI